MGGCKPIIGHNSNSTLGGVELTWSGDGDGVGLEWRWSWELSWSLAIINNRFIEFRQTCLFYFNSFFFGIII